MNWLAHALLSEDDPQARLGNLCADFVKGRELNGMSDAFRRGVRRHRLIDSFTDAHPVCARSRRCLSERYRHLKGVLVDLFYDHFLARDWQHHVGPESLEAFSRSVYADIAVHRHLFAAETLATLDALIAEDWLTLYRTLPGIEAALGRVADELHVRTGRHFALQEAISELVAHEVTLARDFAEFFPQLREHVMRLG
ncbi:MAG: ACP phosphodiesterase [Gemmataceae bacterium]